jgi:FAD:protein FMN transferase
MASEVQVIAVDGPPELSTMVRTELDHLERRWSRFLADSDVARLNTAAGRATAVHDDTVVLVATMVEAWRLTAGAFDPSVLPALVRSGYASSIDDPRQVTLLPSGELHMLGLGDVEVDVEQCTVRLPPGITIDPGGIGKGLAADLIVARLLAAGTAGALVSIGGDLSMAGRAPHLDGWFVAVERPDPQAGDLGVLAVSGGGVATSSTRSRRWTHDGRIHHHLIDPATGTDAATDLTSVTVVAPTAWLAEAHATAALLAGSTRAVERLMAHHLSGIATDRSGRVHRTPDMAGCLP